MSMVFHPAESRGISDHGWLQSRFSFSFAEWHEPERMGFGALRVINDDIIAPRSGFGQHAHRDMEIITIVTAGTVTHGDSMGNDAAIRAGEVQVMTAGTGVAHSEFNRHDVPLTLFQIWILPRARGLQPRYAQRAFPMPAAGMSQLLVSPTGEGESLMIHQDAYIHRIAVAEGETVAYALKRPENGAYVFVISGELTVAGQALGPRDALGIADEATIALQATSAADVLVIEVPMLEE
jgi:hypothetical protein